jgi:hypothetical protein
MQGYSYRPDPNRYTADKWVGAKVSENGTDRTGVVSRAFWQGHNEPVQLYVTWNGGGTVLTDSEHVTYVRPKA